MLSNAAGYALLFQLAEFTKTFHTQINSNIYIFHTPHIKIRCSGTYNTFAADCGTLQTSL